MIIPLIQSLLNPEFRLPDNSEFYKRVIEDIEYFAISPQIYYLLKQHNQLHKTPTFFQDYLQHTSRQALCQNILIRNQTLQILEKCEEMEVQAIPLKGVLFSEKYFGHIGARWTSDIDLLIKPQDLLTVIEIVKSLGFTLEERAIPFHFHRSYSKKNPHAPIPLTVELHWNLLKTHTSNLTMNAFWDQAIPFKQYRFIKELSDYHAFYMVCLHAWRHNLNSLKHFLDIIQLITILNDKLDYDVLWKDADSHKTLKRITKTLAIVYEQFPQLNGIKTLPIKGRTRLWWEYRAIRETNYKTFKQYLNLLQFECFDFDLFRHGFFATLSWITNLKIGDKVHGNPAENRGS